MIPNQQKLQREYGGLREAKAITGLCTISVYRMLRQAGREIENAKVGKRRLINLQDLRDYIHRLSIEQQAKV